MRKSHATYWGDCQATCAVYVERIFLFLSHQHDTTCQLQVAWQFTWQVAWHGAKCLVGFLYFFIRRLWPWIVFQLYLVSTAYHIATVRGIFPTMPRLPSLAHGIKEKRALHGLNQSRSLTKLTSGICNHANILCTVQAQNWNRSGWISYLLASHTCGNKFVFIFSYDGLKMTKMENKKLKNISHRGIPCARPITNMHMLASQVRLIQD